MQAFQRIAGAALLVAAAPLMAVIAMAIAGGSGFPVLFVQNRVGRRGRLFRLYKFRTLGPQAAVDGDTEWSASAPSPFPAWLRSTGLDELPQLWNVVRGEMNLIGPRPERPYFVERFEQSIPGYRRRLAVRPGMTGWAQVHGLRGDTSVPRRLEYDLEYLERRSIVFDVRVLAMTLVGLAAAAAGRPTVSSWRERSTSPTT